MFELVLAAIVLTALLGLAAHRSSPPVDESEPLQELGDDLPCPWCGASTQEEDAACPSCGQPFSLP
ncbi:MAG: hypothetical protein M3N51_03925 [Actinomycetota bacterium]|nr:hypothetical protein [Actinomycetota bacterium]